jgi:hypothetical protein
MVKVVFFVVFLPGHKQQMCCAFEVLKGMEKVRGECIEGIQRGCYESELCFTCDQGCIHSVDSVGGEERKKSLFNRSKRNKTGIKKTYLCLSNRNSRLQQLD